MNFLYRLMKKENILARIISILIACGLWIYVMTDQNPIIERSVEVELKQANLPENMVVFNAPDRVTVKVRGSRSLITDDSEKLISASIDLKNVTEGQQELPVKVLFSHGDIISVSPEEVSVYVDTVSEKTVAVHPRVVGVVSDDLTLGSSKITPSEVTVRGATHRLKNINKVVAPVDVTDQKDNFQTVSDLVAVNDNGYDIPNMKIMPASVTVEATMVRQMITVDVPVKVIMKGNLPDGVNVSKVEVVPKQVRITAPPSVLKDLAEVKTKPVDVSLLTGSITMAAELDLPEKVIPETSSVQVIFSVGR